MRRWIALALIALLAACGARDSAHLSAPIHADERGPKERPAHAQADEEDGSALPPPTIAELFARGEFAEIVALEGEESEGDRAPHERRLIARALAHRGESEAALALFDEAFGEERDYHAQADKGALLMELGRIEEARAALRVIVDAYNKREIAPSDGQAIFAVARASRLLGSARDANRAFHEAARLRPEDVALEIAWAELFLEAHAHEEAKRGLARLLRRSRDEADAHALLVEIYLAEGRPSRLAREEAERVLALDPKNLRAQEILIGLAISRKDEEEALARIERLEEQTHRSVLSLTLRGGLAYLLDQRERFEAIEREILQMNPRPARFYEAIAEIVELDHRYEEAATLSGQALEAIPDDARALARRGMNLLRVGDEAEGRARLREAFTRDPFNRRVHQVLELYETRIDRDYILLDRPPFKLRVHRSEAKTIDRFVVPYLMSALRTLTSRYGFTPSSPIQIELYRDPKDASIRAAGVPDLPFQAICFGRVITGVSPSVGGFNWGQILWHELAHVFHLQMSRGRAPRWLMEGLAERETMISPRAFRRPLSQRIHSFIAARSIPALSDFDALFAQARVMEELVISYGLSTLAVNFLEDSFGIRKIAALLHGFGEGRRFEAMVESELGLSVEALEARFDAYLEELFRERSGRYEPDFEWYPSLEEARAGEAAGGLALEAAIHYRDGRRVEAAAVARRVIEGGSSSPDALFILGKLSQDRERAAALFASILDRSESVSVRLELARIHTELGEFDRALTHLKRAIELDPERPEAQLRIAQIAGARRDHRAEVAALQELMALEPHSPGVPHRLIRRLASAGDHARLLMAAEEARFTSLFDPRIHLFRLIAAASLRERELAREALDDLETLPGPLDGELFRQAIEALGAAGYRAERSALERLFMSPRARR